MNESRGSRIASAPERVRTRHGRLNWFGLTLTIEVCNAVTDPFTIAIRRQFPAWDIVESVPGFGHANPLPLGLPLGSRAVVDFCLWYVVGPARDSEPAARRRWRERQRWLSRRERWKRHVHGTFDVVLRHVRRSDDQRGELRHVRQSLRRRYDLSGFAMRLRRSADDLRG